jgi:cytochrome c oxidase subunit 4
VGIVASFVLFVTIRAFGGQPPSTMNREWEEATNEYLKVRIPSLPLI